MKLKNKNLISVDDLSKEEIENILEVADNILDYGIDLKDKIMATLFFEPSTRTRLSFESAMLRLNGKVIGVADSKTSSSAKGESLSDTIRVIQNYADVIVMRHFINGAALKASKVSTIPIINAGDGSNEHPTQTLIDLYSIKKSQGKLDGLKIALVGDLKFSRTMHSLAKALANFDNKIFFVSPKELSLPEDIKKLFDNAAYLEDSSMIITECDILYTNRIQEERFADRLLFEKLKASFVLTNKSLKDAKDNMRILNPLPRINEIEAEVDSTRHAYYFDQASYAVRVRQAVLALMLGKIR